MSDDEEKSKLRTKYEKDDPNYNQRSSATQNLPPRPRIPRKTKAEKGESSSEDKQTSIEVSNDNEDKSSNEESKIVLPQEFFDDADLTDTNPISHPQMAPPEPTVDPQIVQQIVAAVIAAQNQIQPKSTPKLDLDKLTMSNYVDWARKMKYALQLNNLWINPSTPTNELSEGDKEKSRKAVLFMGCYLDEQNAPFINEKNGQCFSTAWNAIEKFHRPRTSTVLADIHTQIQKIKHKPGQPIETHLMKLEAQFSRLSEINKEIGEEHLVALILSSIHESPTFANVLHSAMWEDETSLTITKVKSVLIATQRQSNTDTEVQAHHAKPFSSGKSYQKRVKRHNRRPKDPINGWKCKTCEMDNHTEENCYKKNRSQTSGMTFRPTHANNIEEEEQNTSAHTVKQISIKERLGHRIKTSPFFTRPSPYLNINPRKSNSIQPSDDVLEINCTEGYELESIDYNDISAHGNENFSFQTKTHQVFPQAHSIDQTNELIKGEMNYQSMNCQERNNEIKTELQKQSIWIIDSGATLHMCQDKNLLSGFIPKSGQNVTISDGSKIPIQGFGTLQMKFKDKLTGLVHTLILDHVAVVPKLTVNLISVQALTTLGFVASFTSDSCYIEHPKANILLGTVVRSAYILKLQVLNQMTKPRINSAMLCIHEWHRRLGHKNIQHVKKIQDTLQLTVDKCQCSHECISCLKGKFHALPFPQQSEKPLQPRDVITTDVCGPLQTQSIGGARYFITFTCANTDYTEVAEMKSKSESKQKLINYINKCKVQFNSVPKIIRGDRGGEFLDNELQSFLENNGITFQCTVPRCPEQNGYSERKNRTLLEGIRTVLFSGNLPKHLWAEALHYVNNTLNNIPKEQNSPSPREKFFNQKFIFPFYEFGSKVFFITNAQNRSKLDSRSLEGLYMGVDHYSKGFRIYSEGKIRIERHVKFIRLKHHHENSIHTEQTPLETSTETSTDVELEPRRSERLRLKQANSIDTSENILEPKTYKQAIASSDKDKWIVAMDQEMNSILRNNTWTEVELPKDRTTIGCKWVYKIKNSENSPQTTYKARLVAQGYTQKFGQDFDEVFAPVTKSATFRLLLTVSSKLNLQVQQYDVKSAFLNGELQEEIYMRPPPGYLSNDKVLKLNKSLYGLKQAARVWNQTLNKAMTNEGFLQSKNDECLYKFQDENYICYAIVHVDDMIFASNSLNLINTKTKALNRSFELKCLGKVQNYLGIEISRDAQGIFAIHQTKYIEKVAEEFNLQDAKGSKYPLDPGYHSLDDSNNLPSNEEYRKLIGMLLYILTNSRPDISVAVAILAQRVTKPRQLDFSEATRIVKYLVATKHEKLHMLDKSSSIPLTAFSDSDWAADRTTRKSISGIVCLVFGSPVSWSSRKQDIVSTSTTESEFYAISEAVKELQWLKNILADFNQIIESPIVIRADNQSTIKMIENPKFSSRTKHIDVRLHFVRESVSIGKFRLLYCPSEENIADLLTKPLAGVKIKFLRNLIGLHE
jgi:hypothetical protein